MKYVSPEYQKQLESLAELICTPDRLIKNAGQMALFSLAELAPTQEGAI